MSKIKASLSLFLASLPLVSKGQAATLPADTTTLVPMEPDPVALRPLNREIDNLFAGHRSHASHASHASHYSSSGGGYVIPPYTPTPAPSYTPPAAPANPSWSTPPSTTPSVKPAVPKTPNPTLSMSEKKKLQVMRVQIALAQLGFYMGEVNGVYDDETKDAVRLFQRLKDLPESGLMTTETLNALGVPAVH